jgi:hypothetical protein
VELELEEFDTENAAAELDAVVIGTDPFTSIRRLISSYTSL